jgi:hypothetical protein
VTTLEERKLMSTFTVSNTADNGTGSLRCEIGLANAAPGANTINFDSTMFNTPLTIKLTSGQLELSNTSGLQTIIGPAAGLTICGGGLSRVFQVDANVTASITGLTITQGSANGAGAGVANYGGTTTLSDCTVSANSATGNGGGLYTNAHGTTTLADCTISGNSATGNGGGLANAYGATTLSGCTITGNSATTNGGGLCDHFGTVTLSDCTISGNFASGQGGGVYNFVGATTMTSVTFSQNFAANGGGMGIFFGTSTLVNCTFSGDASGANGAGLYNSGGTVTLSYCAFSGETATANGGGVFNSSGTATLYNCTVSGNSATGNGGGLYTNSYGTTTLSDCTVSGNSASANGGGLAGSRSTTKLTDCTLSGNVANDGGGVYNLSGTFTLCDDHVSSNVALSGGGLATAGGTTSLSGCTVSGNFAAADGGGAFNAAGTNTFFNCTVSTNYATVGGGVSTYPYGTTTLTDCTVSGNSASAHGGGVDTESSASLLTNCTVAGNTAVNGGGLYTNTTGTSVLFNCTISGNSAHENGGGIDSSEASVTLGNTIVAKNTASGAGPDATGIVNSLGNNLVGATDGSTGWVGSDLTGTSAQPLNPLLAPLWNYGGPTQTMALLPGSLAINSGNNSLIPTGIIKDQRGLPRVVGNVVDIGAFESSLFTIAVTSGSGQSTVIATAFPAPLVATVTANNPIEPVAGGIVTFAAPLTGATATLSGNPATIQANSTVSVGATANGIVGGYAVVAGARGITNTASFNLVNQVMPVITTTPATTSATLGTSPPTLMDTAVLSNGYHETGTLTFTLYLGSTLVNTETVPVNGDGTYTTPTGCTLPTTGTVTGTYQWDTSYSGDIYNTPASENNVAAEQEVVSSANPAIATAPSVTAVNLGASPVTLNDTATLSGGYYETGTITFTLYRGSTLVDTETVSVAGNGSYTTPAGYTLPTTGSVIGTYQWDASYSGDTNNTTSSESNVTAEQVVVNPATPAIATTPSVTAVTLGTAPVTLKDTAALSGGYYETGTITFTLYLGSTLVDTETVAVTGNGTYTTPAGYTLPTTGTVTGTYQWDTTYSGDTNNTTSTESNVAAEQAVVSPATPTIATTPSVTAVNLGTSSVTLKDTATLSGGYYENGTITFSLYLGSTLVDTETASVAGNGSYTTPAGHTLPTTGTVTGTYQWDASYSGDTNNTTASESNVADEQVVVAPATPTIATTPSVTAVTLGTASVTLKDTAVLSGGYYETGTITFTLYLGSTLVDTESVSVNGNGSYTTPMGYTLPTSGTVAGTYQWDASYSGDTNNTMASESNVGAEQVVVSPATPAIATTPSVTAVTLGTAPVTLKDTAVLSGGYYETGTITFTLYLGSTRVDTESVPVNGNGSYTTPTGYTLPTSGTVAGTYQWDASYSGDTNNTMASESNVGAEQVVVSPATPAIATTPSATAVTLGTALVTLKDTAVLSGGYYETGTITFSLYLGSTLVDTESVSVNGNGSYTTPTGYTLPTSGTVPGTYQWDASYSGDTNNTMASESNVAAEQVVVTPATPAISTTPSMTDGPLGASPVTLKDTATLSGGYYETGTITFTLYYGNTLVDTETAAVTGNGSYTTPAGYTLPTTGTVTGTYQWDSSYSSDSNNTNSSESNVGAEQVVVTPATPAIATTPSTSAVTLGIAPVTLKDTAVLSGGYYETGTITFTLYLGSTLVDTETVLVTGNGSYTTPAGYTLPTTGTVTGTYQWDASYGGDSNNNTSSESNVAAEQVVVSPATPAIATTPSVTAVTLGTSPVTLKDTAVLSGGYYETGTITFTLYLGSSLVDTETVSVSGNGSYTTPTGYTLPTTGSVTGTYQWDASYSGDANNTTSSESNVAAERVVVNPAAPAIATTPSATAVTLGTAPVTLKDTAVLSGGYYETGTITFTLYLGSTLVDIESVSVNGNGSYTTPTGYTLPTSGSVTGTYQWNASFSGDTNNTTASESNVAAEQVVVTPATPAIATTPSVTVVTLGTSPITLKDSAVLSGGYYETGTITFTLYLGSTLVDTETVSVNGNGSYTTPTGYTLPTTGTVIGTYQWDASYSGDTNNTTSSESNVAAERVVVNPATPNDSTTPSVNAVTLGTSPANLDDTAVLCGGYYETGTITFTLYQGTTLVDTETVPVNGNGAYSTPTGYTLPTSGTATGSYQWDVSYSGNTNNTTTIQNSASAPQVAVSSATPALSTTPSVTTLTLGTTTTTLKDTAALSGGYYETGSITFTLYLGSTLVDTETVSVTGNGSYTTPTGYTLPTTGAVTGTYQWDASYSGNTNNTSASENNAGTEQVSVSPANPAISTTPNLTAFTLGTTTATLRDTAVVSGGYHESGTITFTLYRGSALEDTETVSVSGDGNYTTPNGYTLPTTGTVAGIYQWDATYGGNSNNNAVSDNNAVSEQVVVSPASPTITTIPNPTIVQQGTAAALTDTATVARGMNPTGRITFTLYQGTTLLDTVTVTVSGNGSYTTPTAYSMPTSASSGVYQWNASYSGDVNNNATNDNNDASERVTVVSPVGPGQFGTIGFWQNKNGQAVINSFNGSSSATVLGNWLASSFPNLFGTPNPYTSTTLRQYGATSLAGLTNAQIATVYNNLWSPSGVTKNTYVQAFAVALGIYADTSSLGGNSTGQQFGFKVTASGGGSATFNVASNGTAFGVANNSILSVQSILQTVNNNFSPSSGTFYNNNQTLTSAANNIVNGINTTGDITNILALSAAAGTVAYTPAQIRAAYGINSLSEDGSGQTIAIVDAYDDPNIFQAVDAFDLQFGLTDSGPSLAAQYGPATSFLTVLNQNGQTTPLPETDPSGPGTANWEVEASLDVEWVHAIAPGARIILVEANSQSLSDLMAAAGAAANQPGVSVVTMSWGLPEGQSVFAANEANYDNVFNVPGVTFLASTGDYGVADPEYPAFSPNVVAVGGTSLSLNSDNSYNSETGWGYYSDSMGVSIGSGGGLSLYESEPAYQQGVQSTGSRTTPDVALVADPATGAWIADPYNLGVDDPFEVVGGTSLSAPAWAGLFALVNEGRAAAGEATLNASSPTESQQALYTLPQSDYNMITSGTNGYDANAGYNLVTGLGTPIANNLVRDLIAYQGPGTAYAGPTVGPLQNATLASNWSSGGGISNDFTVFDAITTSSSRLDYGQVGSAASPTCALVGATAAQNLVSNHSVLTPITTMGTTVTLAPSSLQQAEPIQVPGAAMTAGAGSQTTQAPVVVMTAAAPTGLVTDGAARFTSHPAGGVPDNYVNPGITRAEDREGVSEFILSRPWTGPVADAVLDDLAADPVLWPLKQANGTTTLVQIPANRVTRDLTDPSVAPTEPTRLPSDYTAGLAVLGLAGGLWARGTGLAEKRNRRSASRFFGAPRSIDGLPSQRPPAAGTRG